MIMITPLPGVTDHEAGQRHVPVPGHRGRRRRRRRQVACRSAAAGYLVLKRPWPAMLRGIYGDPERYKETYWSRFPGMYFAGDGAKRDDEGYFWLLGRVDDVMNVSGHRLSTTEVESALVSTTRPSPRPRSSARPTRSPGEAIIAFVILRARQRADRRARRRAARARRDKDQPDRQAQVPDVHAGPAQDPLGQDHAPAAARHRRRAARSATRRPSPTPASSRLIRDEHRRGGGLTCRSTSCKRKKDDAERAVAERRRRRGGQRPRASRSTG